VAVTFGDDPVVYAIKKSDLRLKTQAKSRRNPKANSKPQPSDKKANSQEEKEAQEREQLADEAEQLKAKQELEAQEAIERAQLAAEAERVRVLKANQEQEAQEALERIKLAAEAERVRLLKVKQDEEALEALEREQAARRDAERMIVLQPSTACTWLQEAPAKGQTFDVVVKRGKETKEVFVQTAGFKSKSVAISQTPRGLNEDVVVGARVWIEHLQLEMTVSVPGYELWGGKKALSVILTNKKCDKWLMSRLKGLVLMGDFVRATMLRRVCFCGLSVASMSGLCCR
jgi:dsDNA-specific endonuclease/ATPase MutS2